MRPAEGDRDDTTARRLLRAAERDAERVAALVRVGAALVLLVAVEIIIWNGVPHQATLDQVRAARLFLFTLLGVGIASYVAVRRGWGGGARLYMTTTADAALILGNIAHTLAVAGYPGGLVATLPVTVAVPLILAALTIHYRPVLQIYAAALYGFGLLAIVLGLGIGSLEDRAVALHEAAFTFGVPPNVVRLIIFAMTGGTLVLVAVRSRALLHRAVEETVRRAGLTRFLPREIAPLIGTDRAGSLREGRRQTATIAFVDIRDSTARAEALDPRALSVFIAAFRRRVMAVAGPQGGLVDKFIGDGALVVFGVPEPDPEDAARALVFARDLLARVDRWNRKRGFDPPVRIGIGIHTGEVYCGLVGDEARLEFTVLGDAVNVAARLEEATKRHGVPLLASEATIAAAGAAGWQEVSQDRLRGRAEATRLMRPVG